MIMYAAVGQLIQFCGDFLFRLLYLLGQGFPLFAFEYSLRVGLGGIAFSRIRAWRISPEGYKELSSVCLRRDGAFEAPSTVGIVCRNFSDTLMSVPQ